MPQTQPPEHGAPLASAPLSPPASGEAEYRRLANALPEIIWTCDAHGRLEWCNDRWYELTGLTEAQTIEEKRGRDVIHPDDLSQLDRRWQDCLATGTQGEIEYRLKNTHGEYRWHLARVAPVRDEAGTVTRWVAATLDMHDRHLAEERLRASERRFETVFETIPQATAIIRLSDGAHLHVNDKLLQVTGFAREEIIGQSTVTLGIWTAEERARHIAPLVAADRGSTIVPLRKKDGTPIRLAVSSSKIDFGGEPCMVTVGIDITEQQASEQALRESEAQARIHAAALREADRRKDEFLALLSHELRNPLTPILTAAQILKLRADAEAQEDLDVIIRQVRHLVRLVEDLLDVSRVQRGKVTLNKRRIEVSSIVKKAVEATGPLIQARQHRLDLAVPPDGLAVDADEVRLTQVVNNLLSNAATYTPPGGNVAVSAAREGDSVVLRVRDTGVGIDPKLLPDVFEMFVQGDRSPDRAQGGLGLGLSLVRTLTELHGGTVTAESAGPGRGSEFAVRLPASASRTARRSPGATVRPEWLREGDRQRRVLVVDDNPDVAEMTARLLNVAGYDTMSATDPLTALSIAESMRPHVAILDIGLPLMDGFTLGRELVSRLSDAPPILVAISGYSQDRDRLRSSAAGFALHLAKPVDAEQLVLLLDELVAKPR